MAEEKTRDPTLQEAKPVNIPLSKIHDLPGSVFAPPSEKSLAALTNSIAIKGIQEPVVLRQREDGEFQIVSGNRRCRASELAKKKDIPAFVYDMTEKEARDFRLKDNAQGTPPGKLLTEAEIGKAKDIPAKQETAPAAPPVTVPAQKQKAPAPAAKTPAPEAASSPNAPTDAAAGPAALGPAGTKITQIFDSRLSPPSKADLKNLPVPVDGESFFITLHPAYLKTSALNTVSVDVNSEDYRELRKSIELNGVKDPVLTRINADGGLEILSGQRRHMIAQELNYPVPAIIQKIDDNDAMILVADGNLHRPHISIYDLSRTLRNKMTAMKRKAGRKKRGAPSADELNSDEMLAKEMGISVSKLNRMLRLSEATKDVCDAVDDNSIELSIASEISFLKPKNQDEVIRLSCLGYKPNVKRVQRIRAAEKAGTLNEAQMQEILEDKDQQPVKPPEPAPAAPTPTPSEPAPAVSPTVPSPQPAPAATDLPPKEAQTPVQTTPSAQSVNEKPDDPVKSAGDDPIQYNSQRDNLYTTKVTLGGDRLRKYFPDVTMTPAAIVDSIYSALEERRQREERAKQKTGLLHPEKSGEAR